MFERLLYKLNSNALCLVMLLLLLAVGAVPVPSLFSVRSLESRLAESRDELVDLERRSVAVAAREERLLKERRILSEALAGHFEGLSSPIELRNTLLDLVVATGLKPAHCSYGDVAPLIRGDRSGSPDAKEICSVRIETGGSGDIASILTFIGIVEELKIGITVREFVLAAGDSDRGSGEFSFSMAMDGYFLPVADSGYWERE